MAYSDAETMNTELEESGQILGKVLVGCGRQARLACIHVHVVSVISVISICIQLATAPSS